jgi:hypothetical protein
MGLQKVRSMTAPDSLDMPKSCPHVGGNTYCEPRHDTQENHAMMLLGSSLAKPVEACKLLKHFSRTRLSRLQHPCQHGSPCRYFVRVTKWPGTAPTLASFGSESEWAPAILLHALLMSVRRIGKADQREAGSPASNDCPMGQSRRSHQ